MTLVTVETIDRIFYANGTEPTTCSYEENCCCCGRMTEIRITRTSSGYGFSGGTMVHGEKEVNVACEQCYKAAYSGTFKTDAKTNERNEIMQVKDFCSQMENQIETFRKALSQIEERLDAGGTALKQQILPVVGDIKNLMDQLSLQKARLEQECPADWSDDKSKMENLVGEIGSHVDRTWAEISQGNVGG